MDLQLTGKRALVTGGSRGIGLQIARALLHEGADVAIAARDPERLGKAAAELASLGEPGRVVTVTVDTGDDSSVRAAVAAVREQLGGVDILVNNAAVPAGQGARVPPSQVSDAQFFDAVNVKVVGYLRTARVVAPQMVEQGWMRSWSAAGTSVPSATEHRGRLVFAVLCAATAAYSVLQSLVVPALGVFQRELRTTPSGAAWILTAFLLSASVSTPILGRLADLYGKRPVLAGALAAMSAGSVVSALADGLGVMIGGRLVQGVGGAVFPLCFALVRDHVPAARRPRAFVAISTVMSVGGAAGTVAAGPLVAALSSRWLFGVPAVVSGLAAVAVWLFVTPVPVSRAGARIGWSGALLLASWLTPLLLAISLAPRYGWLSTLIVALVVTSGAVFAAWLATQRRARHPLIDLATLSLPTVRATNAATLALGFGMFGSWMLVPLLVAQPASSGIGFGASPTIVGLVMLPTAVGTLLVAPLGRRLSSRRGPRATLLTGSAAAGASYLLLALTHGSLPSVCVAILLMGGGVGMAFAAVAALVVEAVPLAHTAVSAGVNTVARTVGGSLGATIGGTMLTWSISPSGYPTEGAYTAAMLVYAAALAGAFLCAVRVPRTDPEPTAVSRAQAHRDPTMVTPTR
jgi:MFS family permease